MEAPASRAFSIFWPDQNSKTDRRQFFKAQVVFWLLAATDGHAKTSSLFHLPGGRYRATPLYDILSAHPVIGTAPAKWRRKKPNWRWRCAGKAITT